MGSILLYFTAAIPDDSAPTKVKTKRKVSGLKLM